MPGDEVLALGKLTLETGIDGRPAGTRALEGLAQLAETALTALRARLTTDGRSRGAALSRVRGTGPGVSFGRVIADLERDHPVELRGPFENSDAVTGAIWDCRRLLGPAYSSALLKLRFAQGALDLPLHVHERSDRFIIVLEGRGYFHVCDAAADRFAAVDVRTIPVRSRDALMFTRGVVHTFSAPDEPLILLSFHAPFIALEDSDQFRVPGAPVTPREILAASPPARVSCDPAWNVLACWPGL